MRTWTSNPSTSGRLSELGEAAPKGDAYAPGSSRLVRARLVAGVAGTISLVEFDSGALLTDAPTSRIVREQRLGNLPTVLRFPDGWHFHSLDHGEVDSILRLRRSDRLHKWEAFRPRLALVVAFSFMAAFAVWRWGLAILIAAAIFLTPDGMPRAIDDGHMAFSDRTWASPSRLGTTERDRVVLVFDRLKAVAPPPRFSDYRLVFRDIPAAGPNAFALPGGTVIITDELARSFPDPDVIAGVIGHELVHVAEAHGLKQVYRSLGTYLAVAVILGDVGPVLNDLLLEGGLLFSLAYSREHESEADRIGLALAAKAGYDPAALARFFEQLDDSSGFAGPGWLSTHPSNQDRIAEIKRLADEIR